MAGGQGSPHTINEQGTMDHGVVGLFPSHLKKDHVAADFCPQIFTCIRNKYRLRRTLKNE